ncbi:MAG: hypothetical protein GWM93_20590 [Gemmatimonadetes bacterium]|nr:hypothetical protein [Gemmatimonadota bacterium]NIT69049.1 hypothetical protein [Gemmatimonadota bacterium]NIW77607.1 hypothetical protein [Gemmatimonadota bacterium]NIY37626.1 hypothetical protein [Gemmatimonadota bacterium]
MDTILRPAALDSVDPGLVPQDTAPAPPDLNRLQVGLKTLELPFPINFAARLPKPTQRLMGLRSRAGDWGARWVRDLRERLAEQREVLWLEHRPLAIKLVDRQAEAEAVQAENARVEGERPPPDTMAAAAPQPDVEPAPETTQGQPEVPPDVFGEFADLGVAVQGRVEMGGGWSRFRPCDATFQNCSPSLVPDLKPEIQFGGRVGGTITDRIHVSIDYDNRREFDAANNINVFYQGLEDEILQRVEVGDVSFPLPQSRYLTQGIPAGNFGIRATGQMGPIDFQTVWAQQKGDVGTRELQVGGGGQGFEQTAVTVLDDSDYERGRFFFLFNPDRLSDYPHVDVQRLLAADAPAELRPVSGVKVYRYEQLGFGAGAQIPEGFITAVAVAVDTIQTATGQDTVVTDTLSGLFRPLNEGEDYILHRSGIWMVLRNIVSEQEGLAITYIAANGDTIGTFNAEEQSDAHNNDPDNVDPPSLELIKGINHRPGTATWTRELHNVYRVSASPGVVETSVEMVISQGNPEVGNTFRTTPGGVQLEFLKIFGLDDDPTDNRLDLAHAFQISGTGVGEISGPVGTYIIPPTLEPFKTPPPLRGVNDPVNGQPFPLDPGDRNTTIYDEPNDVVRRGSNLYLLTISYRQRFEGFLSNISLAPGVREDSERLLIDGVELTRGEDYIVDYDIGVIELRDPEQWFRDNPQASVRVTWEQKPLFQIAPTSVFGVQARYLLGRTGEFNFIGLSQSERTLQTRPELGLEPSSVLLTGFSGRLNFQPRWLSNLVDALPGVETEAPSQLTFDGEIALSTPSTNTQGVTYLEDFEGGTGFSLALVSRAWRLGSVPSTAVGAEDVLPALLNEETAAEMVWQDQFLSQTGEIAGPLPTQQIDDQLVIQGAGTGRESALTLTLRSPENRQIAPRPNPPSGPSWASITHTLSASGRDFTTIEYLEFYVAVTDEAAESTTLILDLGTVSEDAFAIDSLGLPSGLGELNREVVPPRVWSNPDDTGLWGTGCEANPNQITYPLGDVAANCTRRNGIEDSEDINQNSVLDEDERFFRYSVKLGDRGGYFVRDANEFGGARFRLYRIPLRRPDHRERVTDAEFQNIRQLRMTVVANSDVRLVLARVRFLGSRWLKRNNTGVVQGLADTTSVFNPSALVEVGPISTLDDRYVPPPGVTEQAASQGGQFSPTSTAINEQSLSISFAEIQPNERAEVYLQYVQTPRDFLAYRSLRVWALGIEGDWGTNGEPLRFAVKLGEDKGNTYVFRTELPAVPPGGTGQELRQAWLPEIVIDMDVFIALRTRAEEIMLMSGGLPGDSTLQIWDVDLFQDGDSSYAVFVNQRSRAANLAAVRQVSLAVFNGGTTTASGQIWIDDMRLDSPTDNLGVVGRFNLDARASDVLDLSVSYASENPYFRQLAQRPSFRSDRSYAVGGRLQFDRFLPDSWRLSMPLTVSYSSRSSQPVLLPGTDVSGERLQSLRTAATRGLRMDLNLSRRPGVDTPVLGWFADNSALRLSYEKRTDRTSRSETETSGYSANYSFRSDVSDVSFPLLPVKDWRFRLTPVDLQFNLNYVNGRAETRRFQEVIELPSDSSVRPIKSLDNRLRLNGSMNFEPVPALRGQVALSQARDLAPTNFSVQGEAARELINAERSRLLGIDLGWLTASTLTMNWTWRPDVAVWLTPQASIDSRYRLNRGASYITQQEADTALLSDFDNSRALRTSLAFNAPVLARSTFGEPGGLLGALLGFVDRFDLISFSWIGTLASQYQRQGARPSLAYQLGLGGFESFRVQDGDTASRVADTEGISVSSGFRLPFGAGITVDYSNNTSLVETQVNQTRSNTVGWPNVNLNWSRVPVPGLLQRWVSTVGLRVGYNFREGRTEVLRSDQVRETETRSIPFSFNIALTTNWSFSYNLDWSEEERRDPTGVSFGDHVKHSIQVSGRLSPLSQQGRFRNPIRVSLRLSQDEQEQCRRLGDPFAPRADGTDGDAAAQSCEPFTDLRIRRVDLTVGTDLPPFVLGLQGSWRDTQSRIGQQPGNTQLEISLFGQFLLETGEIR